MRNALTVDVEEYFHPNAMDGVVPPDEWDAVPHRVERNTYRILGLLGEHDVRATFFVLGWVAQRWPHLVQEIAAQGHEVACHGFAHRRVYCLGPRAFRLDVTRARRVLEDCTGKPVRGFRAASYSIVEESLWALDVLIEEGFQYDSSISPVSHDIYGIPWFSRVPARISRPGGEIAEIPPSTVRFMGRNWPVAGGGYFRLLPYRITQAAIRHLNYRERISAVVYVHPWELDTEQPRLPASRRARFRQYANLRATEPRLRRLLRDFSFAPLSETFDLRDGTPARHLPEFRLSACEADRRPS